MPTDWSSALYLKFADERSRPARDLLTAVPPGRHRIVDLGCGPGNSTKLLRARFPDAEILGVDSSPDMLAAARERLPRERFVQGDAAIWWPESPVDLIFANALFQWVPNHLTVMVGLMSALSPGGVLAVQVPDTFDQPSHHLMRDTAAEGPWAARFALPLFREPIYQVPVYYDQLTPVARTVDIWRTMYRHPLATASAIVSMLESTALRPYLDRLDAGERAAFLDDYHRRVRRAYQPMKDGKVLLGFPRLFIVATKAEA